jgi:hypothetical protein
MDTDFTPDASITKPSFRRICGQAYGQRPGRSSPIRVVNSPFASKKVKKVSEIITRSRKGINVFITIGYN